MKQLEVTQKLVSLLEAVHSLGHEPTAVLQNGRPVAVLLPVEGADLETVALSLNPQFLRSWNAPGTRRLAEGGVSSEEMRRRLDSGASAHRKAKGDGRKAAPKGR